MGRKWMLSFILLAVMILLAMIMPDKGAEAACKAFLSDLGFKTDETFSAETVTLPKEPDDTWEAYLLMQRQCGFNMEPYSGKKVLKYTFSLLNYPFEGAVYANIFWADGKIIGGDIMSPQLDGFMHGLLFDLL